VHASTVDRQTKRRQLSFAAAFVATGLLLCIGTEAMALNRVMSASRMLIAAHGAKNLLVDAHERHGKSLAPRMGCAAYSGFSMIRWSARAVMARPGSIGQHSPSPAGCRSATARRLVAVSLDESGRGAINNRAERL
jgi:hypothetical protein